MIAHVFVCEQTKKFSKISNIYLLHCITLNISDYIVFRPLGTPGINVTSKEALIHFCSAFVGFWLTMGLLGSQ